MMGCKIYRIKYYDIDSKKYGAYSPERAEAFL